MTKDQYESCFRTYYRQLVVFAYKMVRRQDIAEDMVQQVFLSVWEHTDSIDVNKGISAYLYQSTRNKCLNHLSSAYQATTLHVDEPAGEYLIATDRRIEAKELLQRVRAVIQELPEKCREVFLLSRDHGLTYKEIAASLDISVKTVENQMGKALKHLYSRIGTSLEVSFIIYFLTR